MSYILPIHAQLRRSRPIIMDSSLCRTVRIYFRLYLVHIYFNDQLPRILQPAWLEMDRNTVKSNEMGLGGMAHEPTEKRSCSIFSLSVHKIAVRVDYCLTCSAEPNCVSRRSLGRQGWSRDRRPFSPIFIGERPFVLHTWAQTLLSGTNTIGRERQIC